jgi:hypothetical protein
LEKIPDWTWSVKDDFHERALELTKRYIDEFGWAEFRSRTVYEGVAIGAWVTRRRADHRNHRLPQWLRAELEKIPGWKWSLKKHGEPESPRPESCQPEPPQPTSREAEERELELAVA